MDNWKDCWHSGNLLLQFGSCLLILATMNKPSFRSAYWCFHHSRFRHPGLDSVHIPLGDRASCLKPSQPRAPCFPSRHSFLPGAPLEEGGSSSDRTTQTASQPRPDTFLKTERGCSFSSTICPFISYISTISGALSGLSLLFIPNAGVFREGKNNQTNCSDMSDENDDRVRVSLQNEPRWWRSTRRPAPHEILLPLNGSSVPQSGNACCLLAHNCVYNLRWCILRQLTDGHGFCLRRFQRHVHTYRILPDADGLLAVQVSFCVELSFHKPIWSSCYGWSCPPPPFLWIQVENKDKMTSDEGSNEKTNQTFEKTWTLPDL